MGAAARRHRRHRRAGGENVSTMEHCTCKHKETETERDRQTQRETERERQRETDRQTERERETETETDRDRQTQTQTDANRHKQTQTHSHLESGVKACALECGNEGVDGVVAQPGLEIGRDKLLGGVVTSHGLRVEDFLQHICGHNAGTSQQRRELKRGGGLGKKFGGGEKG